MESISSERRFYQKAVYRGGWGGGKAVSQERGKKEVPDPKGQSQSGQRQGCPETEFQLTLTTPPLE